MFGLLISLAIGGLIGWLAGKIMETEGTILTNVVIGVVGSFIGGILGGILGAVSGSILGFVFNVIGACILIYGLKYFNIIK